MSKWSDIRCDFFDEEEEKYFVDAWKTDDDSEEGTVIAKLDLANETVEYLDDDAKTDEYAQEVIKEMLEEGYVLTEWNRNFKTERKVDIMDDRIRAKVIHGEHKGKIGIVTGIFWAANIAIIKTDSDEEISVKPIEIAVNE